MNVEGGERVWSSYPFQGALMSELRRLEGRIRLAMRNDQHRLRQRLRRIKTAAQQKRPYDRNLATLSKQLDESIRKRDERQAGRPRIDFSTIDLPVIEHRDEIATALADHQVIVVCGETGSGKSTQLPKIALDIGQGIGGVIGHTQPRRIAARSIAGRLSDELGCELGTAVGFKIRFADVTRPGTYIKLMTDGILLAETASDRFLDQYDTLIIDEAHERSLNIDFLLGYIKRLLPKRRDLKLVITSATIDAERFQQHFATDTRPVPVIEVSGRTYPVEVRYAETTTEPDDGRPANSRDWQDDILDALDAATSEGPGDVLVFLPTERDIREVARRVRGRIPGAEVLPLYGRLSASDQSRVFGSSKRRRIVLATNVAESSVTVPGIRFVIDTGTARISRYSARSRIQRLPIEAVSRASADQRKGRCGRVGPGLCIRLYDEADYNRRDEYTQPEIQRSNLASVILRAAALRLGDVEQFPFVDPPRPAAVRDGYRTLFELGAVDEKNELTSLGRSLSHLPVDPRIGRMILAAIEEQCLHEVLIIASGLELQDPRDRPAEKQEAADAAHEKFRHEESDFLTLLNIWNFFHEQKEKLSNSRLRRACQQNFLNWNRMREWGDLYRQLRELVERIDNRELRGRAIRLRKDRCEDYDAIHRALLAGLLSGVAFKAGEHAYTGADQIDLALWPGSVLFKSKPRWFVAAELVETTRRFARMAARINPNWIESLAAHVVKRSWSDPHWHVRSSGVMAWEKVTLFGLTIVARRRGPFAPVDPVQAREVFIRAGLVERQFETDAPFMRHNRAVLEELDAMEARTRRRDLTPDEDVQFEFYDRLIPPEVVSGSTFDRWRRRAESRNPRLLFLRREEFLSDSHTDAAKGFPDALRVGQNQFALQYRLEPGSDDDGITMTVPQAGLAHIPSERLGWLVPGLLEEKVVEMIRSLPKQLRRLLVPAPDTAREVVAELEFGKGSIETELARLLTRVAGDIIRPDDFDLTRLPRHLRMNVRVIDEGGESVGAGRDVGDLQLSTPQTELSEAAAGDWSKDDLQEWPGDEIPVAVGLVHGGMQMRKHPTLVDCDTHVNLRLFDDETMAAHTLRGGVRRLFALREQKRIRSHLRHFPSGDRIRMICAAIPGMQIESQLVDLVADRAVFRDVALPRTREAFEQRMRSAANAITVGVQDVAALLPGLFDEFQESRRALDRTVPPSWTETVADARNQISRLICPGFLLETPWNWLAQFPRYLKAVRHRLDRLQHGGLQSDARNQRLIAPYEEAWQKRFAAQKQQQTYSPELVHFRWMVEEFRVSLFAQQLGTAVTVSAKRLDRQWKKATR